MLLATIRRLWTQAPNSSGSAFIECLDWAMKEPSLSMFLSVSLIATRGLLSAPMTTSGAESALPEAVSEAAGNPQESHGCHHGEVPETQNLNDLLQPKEPAAPEIALSTAEEAVWMAHSLLNVGHCRAPCSLLELAGAYPASQAAVAKTGRVAG
eukprot:s3773_g6.t1